MKKIRIDRIIIIILTIYAIYLINQSLSFNSNNNQNEDNPFKKWNNQTNFKSIESETVNNDIFRIKILGVETNGYNEDASVVLEIENKQDEPLNCELETIISTSSNEYITSSNATIPNLEDSRLKIEVFLPIGESKINLNYDCKIEN